MSYDKYSQRYRQPGMSQDIYGQREPVAPNQPQQALVQMPYAQDMGGQQEPKFVRAPFYPTAPYYSTNPSVGYATRYYSTGLIQGDADYAVGVAATRRVQFDLPCRLIALNAAVQTTTGVLGTLGTENRLDTFLVGLSYTTGDQILVGNRLGSTICGDALNPGELGGTGYPINTGASMLLQITPLFVNLRIDIVLVCLEMRGSTNYSVGG